MLKIASLCILTVSGLFLITVILPRGTVFGNKQESTTTQEDNSTQAKKARQNSVSLDLNQKMEASDLPPEQKSIIEEKNKELADQENAFRVTIKDLSKEERLHRIADKKNELKKWADEHGIPFEYLNFFNPLYSQEGL